MRETCARVLAAALMTGAIGFALAMPAIFETAHKAAGRSLTAPPSSLQRSVHVVASAPSLSARDGRLERTQPIQPASFLPASRSGSARNDNIPASGRHSSRVDRSERAPKPAPPKPTPAPAPATRELADTTPAAAASPPAPSQPAASPDGTGKGKKKAKQHAKSKGKPAQPPQPPVAATTPQPANEPPASEGEKDHGNGNGNDKDKDKGKGDDKGRDG
jgi:hypothetical protein